VDFYFIAAGRPNGMPAYGARLPTYQVWQLTAYVRSMSGLGSKDAAPGREDHMEALAPENSRALNSRDPRLIQSTPWISGSAVMVAV
jgi:cytochrome c oxidase cbb3-type subunit 3